MLFNHYLPYQEFRLFYYKVEKPLAQAEISKLRFGNIQETEKFMVEKWLENPKIYGDYYFNVFLVKPEEFIGNR